jgi:hypothetical protein
MSIATASMPYGTALGAVLFGLVHLFIEDPQVAVIGYAVYSLAEIAPYLLPDYNTTAAKIANLASITHGASYQLPSLQVLESSTGGLIPETQTVLITESSAVPTSETPTTSYATTSVDSLARPIAVESEPVTIVAAGTLLDHEESEESKQDDALASNPIKSMAKDMLAWYLEEYRNFKHCANSYTAFTWYTYTDCCQDWASVWYHLIGLGQLLLSTSSVLLDAILEICKSIGDVMAKGYRSVALSVRLIGANVTAIPSVVNTSILATTRLVSGTLSKTCHVLLDTIVETCQSVGDVVVKGYQSVASFVRVIGAIFTSIPSVVNNSTYATTTFVSGTLPQTCAQWLWRTLANKLVSILAAPSLTGLYRDCSRVILSVAVLFYKVFSGVFVFSTENFWDIPIAIVTTMLTNLCIFYRHECWMAMRGSTIPVRGLVSDVCTRFERTFVIRAGPYVCNKLCGASRTAGVFIKSIIPVGMVKNFLDDMVVPPVRHLWQLTLELLGEALLGMNEATKLDLDTLWNDTEAEPNAPVVEDEKLPEVESSFLPEKSENQARVPSDQENRSKPPRLLLVRQEVVRRGQEAKVQRREVKLPATPAPPSPLESEQSDD